MTIMYELNPPRLDYGDAKSSEHELVNVMLERVSSIIPIVDGIHVTDAVLGTRRLDVLQSCTELRRISADLKITMSLRTRDRTFEEIASTIDGASRIGVSAILLVRGDPPQYDGAHDSRLYPGAVLEKLRTQKLTRSLLMLLSLSPAQDDSKIQKKISLHPDGFITQVISSESQVQEMVLRMRAHKIDVTPCVMLPSPKNAPSARLLDLDWSNYKDHAVEFVRKIEEIAGSVLITSPNDRVMAESILRKTSTMPRDDGQ